MARRDLDLDLDLALKQRALALFLAGVYAFGALAGLLHVATVEHRRCEHGDVVHASLVEVDDRPALVWDESRLTAGERGATHGDSHDHCDVSAPSTQCALAVARQEVSEARGEAGEPLAAPVRAVVGEERGQRYRLAPKGSPPTA